MSKKKDIISKSEMVSIRDSVTNEIEMAKVTVSVQRDVPKYREPFTILFQATTLAMGRDISPAASKLLINLCGCVGYGNVIEKGIEELAEHMGYSLRQIYRAFKELEGYNVVIKSQHPQDKRITQYHLNAHQSWKGTKKERKEKIATYDKNQLDIFKQHDQPKTIKPNKDF